eukprot:CAMPEP_0185791686 /NCGR_PEP_ID=MMETSP1174-20130828/158517_1 /TAXON_ID=35687 /ORGANISM="Dictyocha speculum, Strain CCMP1381" /LENGTH=81 /DNA_ID=CAMNT_0028486673 /DNA_START=1115 /DNA_END=1360 /DNA_ORIENTATION=+
MAVLLRCSNLSSCLSRAKVDVEGLGRIIMESASTKEFLFTKVDLPIKTWAWRKQPMIARNVWKAARDAANSAKESLNESAP